MVWLNYFAKATTSTPTFRRKPAVWHASHPFLSVLPKESSSIHLRDTVWKVKLKCFRTELNVWSLDLADRLFTLAYDHFCTFNKVTGILAVNSASSSLSVQPDWLEQVSHFFRFFKTCLPFPLPWSSNDLLVENLAVTFEIHLCSSGLTTESASFPFCARRWSQQLTSYPKRCSPFQKELQIMARLRVSLLVWKPFRCHLEGRVRLSLEACGDSCTRASCQRHFILTGEKWK